MEYKEEDYLQLSGLQHFLFCRRQWALIHIERQWKDNGRTVDGNLLHKNVHDADHFTHRGDRIIIRAMRVASSTLGVSGECDAVEFRRDPHGVALAIAEGRWIPYPMEYKRGKPKAQPWDHAQLCAQALCLEEMLCCEVPEGAIYYGGTRHRERVILNAALRETVREALAEMHDLYERGHTPKTKRTKSCNACSLKDVCLPELSHHQNLEYFLQSALTEDLL